MRSSFWLESLLACRGLAESSSAKSKELTTGWKGDISITVVQKPYSEVGLDNGHMKSRIDNRWCFSQKPKRPIIGELKFDKMYAILTEDSRIKLSLPRSSKAESKSAMGLATAGSNVLVKSKGRSPSAKAGRQ